MPNLTIPIVSVHTPKVAGSTFLQHLRTVLGVDTLLLDYEDDPADHRSQGSLDPISYQFDRIKTIAPYRAVHGHFRPEKYDGLGSAFRLTFLRHPVENVISIYRYWRAHPTEMWSTPLFCYFKEHALSLKRLAMLPTIRFLYSKTYFGGFDMNRFDFIGDYGDYSQELQRLGVQLGVEFDFDLRVNVTGEILGDDSKFDASEIAALTETLAEDIKFYEQYAGR